MLWVKGLTRLCLEALIKPMLLQSLEEMEYSLSTLTAPSVVSHIPSCRSLGAHLDQESINVKMRISH